MFLERDHQSLEDTIRVVSGECRSIESDIWALKNKHEQTVGDLSNKIRRFEESNYNVHLLREELDKNNLDKANECRNLSFALRGAKESANKREVELNETNNHLEAEQRKESELYRSLLAENARLSKQ